MTASVSTKPQLIPVVAPILKTTHETYSLITPSNSHTVNFLYIIGIVDEGKTVIVRSVNSETIPTRAVAGTIAKTGRLCTTQFSERKKTFTASEQMFKEINKKSVVKILLQEKSGNIDLGYIDDLISAEKSQYQGFIKIIGLFLRSQA